MSKLPYEGICVVERSGLLSARLIGLLLADQGARVLVAQTAPPSQTASPPGDAAPLDPTLSFVHLDPYLNRGKGLLRTSGLEESSTADIIIVQGTEPVTVHPWQILVRVVAAFPGDACYGHLPADCSEDLLSATLGFFTDMALTGRVLHRPVIYTPLPLSSVYAAVIGAVSVGAALTERLRSGSGCEIYASRLAGGLAAMGALALTQKGLPPHLDLAPKHAVPPGVDAQEFSVMVERARQDGDKQSWLEQRLIPFGVPFKANNGSFLLLLNGVNRRATRKLYEHLNIWDTLLAQGLTDISPYEPASLGARGRNLADGPSLAFQHSDTIAQLLSEILVQKTAEEWERELCAIGVPVCAIKTLPQWLNDPQGRQAGLTTVLKTEEGPSAPQLGRAAWLHSAQPYPELKPGEALSVEQGLQQSQSAFKWDERSRQTFSPLPLAGTIVLDLTNVIAGPNAARMLGELGASVYRVEQPDPTHMPLALTIWGAEAGAGKKSVILDTKTPKGREILQRLIKKADFIVINKGDAQCQRLGVDLESLAHTNPKAILVQLTAHHGEKHSDRHDYPGYDPIGQAMTGIMKRFGPEGCPTYHGLASCVDYITGYLAVWAAVSAYFAQSRSVQSSVAGLAARQGDRAESSLMSASSLVGCAFLYGEPPAHQCGPQALGRTSTQRAYQVVDGWVYALAPEDLSAALSHLTVQQALTFLGARGIESARVNTVREMADTHREAISHTIRFQEREHARWVTECFVPTWFCFNQHIAQDRLGAVRIGSSADAVLQELNYTAGEIDQFKADRVILGTEWT
jgi:crotonobetainyl-CoA:carnitine CoA-transferase CaiB-like acyl-CoA transferase